MSDIDQLREAIPEYRDLSDDAIIHDISKTVGDTPESVAEQLGYKPGNLVVDTAKAAGVGLAFGAPKMIAQAVRSVDADSPAAKSVEDWATRNEDKYRPSTVGRGLAGRTIVNAAEGIGSAVPALAADLVAPEVGIPATAALFGGSQYSDTRDQMLAAGKTPDEASSAALKTGGLAAAVGAATGGVNSLFLKGSSLVGKAAPKTIDEAVAAATDPAYLGQLGKDFLAHSASNATLMGAQSAGTAAIDNSAGLDYQSPLQAGGEGALTGLAMSGMMSPVSLLHARAAAGDRAALGHILTDDSAPLDKRFEAAATTAQMMVPHTGQGAADAWHQSFTQALLRDAYAKANPDELLGTANKAPDSDPDVQMPSQGNMFSQPANPYDVGGHVSALQRGAPTTVDGHADLFGTNEQPPAAPPPAAPQISKAPELPAPAINPVTPDERMALINKVGIHPGQTDTGAPIFTTGGKQYFTEAQMNADLDKQVAKERVKTDIQHAAEQAYANAVRTVAPEEGKGLTITKLESQTKRFAEGANSVEDVAARVKAAADKAAPKSGKNPSPTFDRLTSFYEHLTGKEKENGQGVDEGSKGVSPEGVSSEGVSAKPEGSNQPGGIVGEPRLSEVPGQDAGSASAPATAAAPSPNAPVEPGPVKSKLRVVRNGQVVKESTPAAPKRAAPVAEEPARLDEDTVRTKLATESGLTPREVKAMELVKGADEEDAASSLRAAALELGVSHQTVARDVASGIAKIKSHAQRLGISEQYAHELLGLAEPEKQSLDSVSDSEVAGMGGMQYRSPVGARRQVEQGEVKVMRPDASGALVEVGRHAGKAAEEEGVSSVRTGATEGGADKTDEFRDNRDTTEPIKGNDDLKSDNEPPKMEETAEDKWDVLHDDDASIPKFSELSDSLQQKIEEMVEEGKPLGPKVIASIMKEHGAEQVRRSEIAEKGSSTPEKIVSSLKDWFFSKSQLSNKVTTVQSWNDLPEAVRNDPRLAEKSEANDRTQGFVLDGHAYLIADNIPAGKERSVFMHEVGAHIGLTEGEESAFAGEVRKWADAKEGSVEKQIFDAVRKRMESASETSDSELIAYAAEEAVNAGVKPTMVTAIGRWLKGLVEKIMAAIGKKFSAGKPLSAQDIVDYLHGAAHVALDSEAPVEKTEAQFSTRDDTIERNIEKLPKPLQASTLRVTDTINGLARTGLQNFSFVHDLVDHVKKYIPSATKWYDAMSTKDVLRRHLEVAHEQILSDWNNLNKTERGTGQGSVSQFLKDATMDQKWHKQYDWLGREVKVDPRMEARYNAMSPSARSVVDSALKHGADTLKRKVDLLKQEIQPAYDKLIAEADEADRPKLEKEMTRRIGDAQKLLSSLEGPYMPIKRFGDFVAVGKSDRYLAAEREGNKKELEKLESDPQHYQVDFYGSEAEAKAAARNLAFKFPNKDGAYAFQKEEWAKQFNEAPFLTLQRIKNIAESHFGDKDSGAVKAINKAISDLYISTITEASARKSELRRRFISGQNIDMMQSFATQGRADAHFIAALSHNNEILDHVQAMRTEAKEVKTADRMEASRGLNTILQHQVANMAPNTGRWQNRVMQLTSFWQLATSPAHYMQNLTQPMMMTLPMLEGRFGPAKSWGKMIEAYRDLSKLVGGKAMIGSKAISIDGHVSRVGNEKAMLEALRDRGLIDVGIDTDMGWLDTNGKVSRSFASAQHRLSLISRNTFAINGIATGLSAYRLAHGQHISEGRTADEAHALATKYAIDMNRQTQGDWTGAGAPLAFKKLPRVVTQFRKFQLIQLAYVARMVHDSFKGATPEERTIARASLGFALAHHGVIAGAFGLPGAIMAKAMIGWAFGDDNTPEDGDKVLREAIGDKELATFILEGAPAAAGIDMSRWLGMGDVTSPVSPFAKFDISSRASTAESIMSLAGPWGGITYKWADGMSKMSQGDYYKGLEQLLPNGVSNAMKGYRYMDEGYSNKKGDTLMTPDEIGFGNAFAAGLGLKPTALEDRARNDNLKFEYDKFFKDHEEELLHRYTMAVKNGDDTSDIRQKFSDMQQAQRDNGFAVSPLSKLLQAPLKQRERERQVSDGVMFSKKDAGFVKSLADE